ncbi:MAG: hypothetical protein Q8P07_05900 [bacterium]|nr:hypothetical protein [bacterium]
MKNMKIKNPYLKMIFLYSLSLIIIAGAFHANAAGLVPCVNAPCTPCDIWPLAKNIVWFVLFQLAIPVLTVALLTGGVMILVSAGNQSLREKGKATIWNGVIGILIAFTAYLVISTIITTLAEGRFTAGWKSIEGCTGTDTETGLKCNSSNQCVAGGTGKTCTTSSDCTLADTNDFLDHADLTEAQTKSLSDLQNQNKTSQCSGAPVIDEINGVCFKSWYNGSGPIILFDSLLDKNFIDNWLAQHANELAFAPPDHIIYIATEVNGNSIGGKVGKDFTGALGLATAGNYNYPDDPDTRFSGFLIKSNITGVDANGNRTYINISQLPANKANRFPDYFANVSRSEMTLLHEMGHELIIAKTGENDSTLYATWATYQNLVNQGRITPLSRYGGKPGSANQHEFGADVVAIYDESGGAYQPADKVTAQFYNQTVDYFKSKGILK